MSDDGDAVITLNAPHRLNTIGRKMASGVQHALDLASEDSKVWLGLGLGLGLGLAVRTTAQTLLSSLARSSACCS